MQLIGLQETCEITCRESDAPSPFEFQEEHGFVTHPTRATNNRFDGRVQRFDDAEADRVKAVGGDPVEVLHEEGTKPVHLREPLPRRAFSQPIRKLPTPCGVL